MRTALPPVGDLPADKVLKLRDKFKNQLDDFRVEMAALVEEIQEQLWEPSFDARIKQVVNTKLRPRLRALKWDLQDERDRYWMEEASGRVVGESKASWVTSVLIGAPLPGILLGVGRSAFNLFSGWLSHKRQERALKRNGLTYLLQIQRAYA